MVGFSLPGLASQKTEKTFGSDDRSGDDGHALALTAAGKLTMTPKSSYWHDDLFWLSWVKYYKKGDRSCSDSK